MLPAYFSIPHNIKANCVQHFSAVIRRPIFKEPNSKQFTGDKLPWVRINFFIVNWNIRFSIYELNIASITILFWCTASHYNLILIKLIAIEADCIFGAREYKHLCSFSDSVLDLPVSSFSNSSSQGFSDSYSFAALSIV